MLNNEDVALFNVNKLKAYQNPIELIIIVDTIIVSIGKLENILPKIHEDTNLW
jgi:hypothetical protein